MSTVSVESFKKSLKETWKTSLQSSALGGLAYAFFEVSAIVFNSYKLGYFSGTELEYIRGTLYAIFIWFLIVALVATSIVSVPAMIGGTLIYRNLQYNWGGTGNSSRTVIIKGIIIGGGIALIISGSILGLLWRVNQITTHKTPMDIQYIRAVIAIIIGSAVGGFAGNRFQKEIGTNTLDNTGQV